MYQKLTFTNKRGEKLSAQLDLPVDGRPGAYALFAHCFTCTKNLKAVVNINRTLNREGIAVLRFDFTGLGESEGDFSDTTFSSNVEDLISAAEFLETTFQGPQILIGHSLGGAAVLQAASSIPSAKAVATIGTPGDPKHVNHLLKSSREKIETEGEAEVMLGGKTFKIKKQFLEDLEQTRMHETLRNLRKALLILHSPLDEIVGIDNAAQLYQVARHPKSFISLDRADHLLTDANDSIYVGSMIASWGKKYIDLSREAGSEADSPEDRVMVRTGKDGFRTEIMVRGHSLIADEPISAGGKDRGPTPYEYLSAGLGACTSITLRMYADRKSWPLDSINVRLAHRKIHAQDCESCETQKGYVDEFEREIELVGPLDDLQRERLLQIADRCPVHRSLHSEIRVKTHMKT
jgi:putative redox protein